MGRPERVASSGGLEPNPVAIGEQVDNVLRVVDGQIEFGDPQDPADPTSSVLAGEMGVEGHHNGTVSNIMGSWVEAELVQVGLTIVTCTHNLYLQDSAYVIPIAGEPNCRWLLFGVMHDGTGADPAIASTRIGVDIGFIGGDTVNANDIQLRMNLRVEGSTITLGSSNPVRVTLFFTGATRGE